MKLISPISGGLHGKVTTRSAIKVKGPGLVLEGPEMHTLRHSDSIELKSDQVKTIIPMGNMVVEHEDEDLRTGVDEEGLSQDSPVIRSSLLYWSGHYSNQIFVEPSTVTGCNNVIPVKRPSIAIRGDQKEYTSGLYTGYGLPYAVTSGDGVFDGFNLIGSQIGNNGHKIYSVNAKLSLAGEDGAVKRIQEFWISGFEENMISLSMSTPACIRYDFDVYFCTFGIAPIVNNFGTTLSLQKTDLKLYSSSI